MKLLLDESVPRRLTSSFPPKFEVATVQSMGWAGTKNGELLRLASDARFSALITADRGIEYQQNLKQLTCTVIIMRASRTRLSDLLPLVPRVIELLESKLEIGVYRVDV